ncbi:MAG: recombinase family protein [Pseudobdellovibrionaceae bacterium]
MGLLGRLLILLKKKIGWGDFLISEPLHLHEIIEFRHIAHRRITEKAVEFYEKGHSIAESAAMAGMPASTLFDEMKANNIPRRSWRKAVRPNAPYGYAWLSGELVINPLEYKNVRLILEISKAGKRPHQIAEYLNQKGVKPRRGKRWFARTITDIILREAPKL